MKKRLFYIIYIVLSLSVISAESCIKTANLVISIDESIENVKKDVGDPLEVEVVPFDNNNVWDTICYKYNDFWLFTYRKTSKIYRISVHSQKYRICINDIEIICGFSREYINELIGEGWFLLKNNKNYNVYLYEFENFIEAHLFFDDKDILKGILFGYQNPD